jgi:hypothetical protein
MLEFKTCKFRSLRPLQQDVLGMRLTDGINFYGNGGLLILISVRCAYLHFLLPSKPETNSAKAKICYLVATAGFLSRYAVKPVTFQVCHFHFLNSTPFYAQEVTCRTHPSSSNAFMINSSLLIIKDHAWSNTTDDANRIKFPKAFGEMKCQTVKRRCLPDLYRAQSRVQKFTRSTHSY